MSLATRFFARTLFFKAFFFFALAGISMQVLSQITIESATTSQITNSAHQQNARKKLNLRGHQHNAITSFNGYQYAAFYEINNSTANRRYVTIARRKLPNGSWEKTRLSNYTQTTNDPHNVISIGICEGDGTIHLAFDHHNSTLNYRVSVQGLATQPENHSWTGSKFGNVLHTLPGTSSNTSASKQWTYPRFISVPNGNLQIIRRHGSAISGATHLYTYDKNTHSWSHHGEIIDGRENLYLNKAGKKTKLGPYLNGANYQGSRLHISWVWRTEGRTSDQNFDLMYAYSDDYGISWKNTYGEHVGRANSSPMTYQNSPAVRVIDFPEASGITNQTGQTVDQSGRVHIYQMQYKNDGKKYFHHIMRDTDGTWVQNETDHRGQRGKMTHDVNDNVYAIHRSGTIFTASPNDSYKNWSRVRYNSDFAGEALFDEARMRDNGVISMLVASPDSSKRIHSLDIVPKSQSAISIHSVSAQQLPNTAQNLLDKLKTNNSRWSAKGFSQSVVFDLGSIQSVSGFKLWSYLNRAYRFEVGISHTPDSGFTRIVNRRSNTSTNQPISNTFSSKVGRYVKLTVIGASHYSGSWVSINEVEIVLD